VPNQSGFEPWWAACTVWGVVNAVNVLQAAGLLSRIPAGGIAVNQLLGYAIIVLAVPSTVALFVFVLACAGWLYWAGPTLFLAFVALMVVVDYARPVEFRSPMRYEVLALYLGLFFGAIFLMGPCWPIPGLGGSGSSSGPPRISAT
jgi:hypothetical protein